MGGQKRERKNATIHPTQFVIMQLPSSKKNKNTKSHEEICTVTGGISLYRYATLAFSASPPSTCHPTPPIVPLTPQFLPLIWTWSRSRAGHAQPARARPRQCKAGGRGCPIATAVSFRRCYVPSERGQRACSGVVCSSLGKIWWESESWCARRWRNMRS